jgi:hypothetical protein
LPPAGEGSRSLSLLGGIPPFSPSLSGNFLPEVPRGRHFFFGYQAWHFKWKAATRY